MMALDIWSRDDIRNVILAANAASADVANLAMSAQTEAQEHEDLATYRAGYEAALMTLAMAFGIPLVAKGHLRSPGVVIPGGRLAVSYRAERSLTHLLESREEMQS